MNTDKELSRWQKIAGRLLSSIFSIALLVLPGAIFAAFWLTNPDTVKQQLAEARVYEFASDIAAREISKQATASVGELADTAMIERASRETFTSSAVQKKIEPLIDENFAWLNGARAEPSLKLDISAEQQKMSERISKEAAAKYEQKPVCSLAELQLYQAQIQANPLEAPCRITLPNNDNLQQRIQQQITAANPPQQVQLGIQPGASVVGDQQQAQVEYSALKGIYWQFKYGLFIVIGVLVVVALLAAAVLRLWQHWIEWLKAQLLSMGILLIAITLLFAVLTQTDWMSLGAMTNDARFEMIAILLRTPLALTGVVASGYILLAIFAILIKKRRHQYNDREPAIAGANAAAADEQIRTPGASSSEQS